MNLPSEKIADFQGKHLDPQVERRQDRDDLVVLAQGGIGVRRCVREIGPGAGEPGEELLVTGGLRTVVEPPEEALLQYKKNHFSRNQTPRSCVYPYKWIH